MGKEDKSSFYRKWNKEIDKLADNKSRYEWDEIEELITDEFENENITSDEFDSAINKVSAANVLLSIVCLPFLYKIP